MQIEINGIVKDVPSDLSQISLGKFISYYEEYGRELDKQLGEIINRNYKKYLPEEKGIMDPTDDDIAVLKELDIEQHLDKEALAWYSFFTGFDFEELKGLPSAEPILQQYRFIRYLLQASEDDSVEFPYKVAWNDEEWEIQNYKVDPRSDMSFNEIITSKETMRQIHALGKSKWDALIYLCAIFFRKKGEPYTDGLIDPAGDRIELLKELPMSIAIKVAFFLSCCVNIWLKGIQSSPQEEVQEENLNSQPIMNSGGG